jgi:hypothetical protein
MLPTLASNSTGVTLLFVERRVERWDRARITTMAMIAITAIVSKTLTAITTVVVLWEEPSDLLLLFVDVKAAVMGSALDEVVIVMLPACMHARVIVNHSSVMLL